MRSSISIMLQRRAADGLVGGRVTFEDRNTGYDFVSEDPLAQLQIFSDSIRNNVEDYLLSGASDALVRVADAGWLLLDSLLGTVSLDGREDPALKLDILSWLGASDGVVNIDSSTMLAPWNFLYLSPMTDEVDVTKFVGSRHLVLQRLNQNGRVAPVWPVRKLLAVHGKDDHMVEETNQIVKHAVRNNIACHRFPVDRTPVADCTKAFAKLWESVSPSVLHIASHLRSAQPHLSEISPTAMDDSVDLYENAHLPIAHLMKTLNKKRDTMELGFFNLCRLGRGSSVLDGGTAGVLSRRLACTISVDMLLETGAGMRFADSFYISYLSGCSAAKAFANARRVASASISEAVGALCYRFTYMYPEMHPEILAA